MGRAGLAARRIGRARAGELRHLRLRASEPRGEGCAAAPEYARGMRLALGAEIKRERMLEGVARVVEFLRRA